jgi:uncharacterized repeat protein (TIGR03806 family)
LEIRRDNTASDRSARSARRVQSLGRPGASAAPEARKRSLHVSASAFMTTLLLLGACTGEIEPNVCSDCGLKLRVSNQTCRALAPPPLLAEARVAYPSLPLITEPVAIARPAGSTMVYVTERHGRLLRFEDRPDVADTTTVLDLTAEVDPMGDAGLVAAAFHPRFDDNGQLFLSYTAHGGTVMRSRVVRFTSPDGGASFDPSGHVLLDLDQEYIGRIHLNAGIAFGPDGLLYVGLGDGGPQGDPLAHAQNMNELRGKILRVDVDHGEPYAIPSDNPFVGKPARPEIYAFGLRNPWQLSFDRATGDLWLGDVGFDTTEEVDRVPAGGNMGWPVREGSACFRAATCATDGLVPPVAEYPHDKKAAAVVGGFVYHGHALPALAGRYVYADYARGDVWALDAAGAPELIAQTARRIVSFAEEPDGELLMVDVAAGLIFRLVAAPPSSDAAATLLSQTGCFRADDPTRPAPGLVPYDVRVPFWSDGAVKRRFFALPDGERAVIRPDGALDMPVGSVLVKEFFLGSQPVETRLLMKYREGQWAGYTYAWDDEGRDATLVGPDDVLTSSFGGGDWSYPQRSACLGCHTGDRGLGLEVAQLDLDRVYTETGWRAQQLPTLLKVGLVTGGWPTVPVLPKLNGDAPLADRARAYLHVNCAPCHTPDGPTPVQMDLRYSTPLAKTGLCEAEPQEGDLGVAGALRLAPGSPHRSLLSLRMRAQGADHMPPLGPHLVDATGAKLVDSWISGLARCP